MPCGGGIGALGAQVVLTIERLLPGGGTTPVWTGDIYSLTNADLATAIPGGAVWEYRFRSEEHTSELQSLMRISYAYFCLKTKNQSNKKQLGPSAQQS